MLRPLLFWPAFCVLLALMQGWLMPAIRRTPPGEEAKRQAFALHVVGTLAYFLPWALTPTALSLVLACAARLLFDPVLNAAAGSPLFYVGRTAFSDRLLRKLAGNSAPLLSAALRVLALAGVAIWLTYA